MARKTSSAKASDLAHPAAPAAPASAPSSGSCKQAKNASKTKKKNKSGISTRQRDFRCHQVYHVYQRGNQGKKTFHDQTARFLYLEHLFLLARRHSVRVHNFCLMHNHVHFVLHQERVEGISKMMQELQPYHARFHNQRLNKTGNLWQQHFGCKHVDSDEYYVTLMLYVERNPLLCRRASNLAEYKWSGASAHIHNDQVEVKVGDKTLTTDLYLDYWREKCSRLIETGWGKVLLGRTLDSASLEKIEAMLDGKKRQAMAQKERAKRRQEEKAEQAKAAAAPLAANNPPINDASTNETPQAEAQSGGHGREAGCRQVDGIELPGSAAKAQRASKAAEAGAETGAPKSKGRSTGAS